MESRDQAKPGSVLSPAEAERYFDLRAMLFEFAGLFDYEEPNDRAIVVVGAAFLDTLLTESLRNFLVEDEKEVDRLLRPDGPLGTYGSRVTACFCLGLIGKIVMHDLRLIGKIRNRFAHDLRADFADSRIESWCQSLKWHRIMFPELPPDATTRDLYQVGVHQLVTHLNGIVGVARMDKRREREHT